MDNISEQSADRCELITNLKGVNKMSFRNPDRLKKKKNITKKIPKDPKDSTKKVSAKKPK